MEALLMVQFLLAAVLSPLNCTISEELSVDIALQVKRALYSRELMHARYGCTTVFSTVMLSSHSHEIDKFLIKGRGLGHSHFTKYKNCIHILLNNPFHLMPISQLPVGMLHVFHTLNNLKRIITFLTIFTVIFTE